MELTTTVSFSGKSINLHWSLMKAFSGRIPPNLKTRIVNFFFLDTQTPFFVFTLYKIYPPKRYEMKRYLVNITMHCWVKLRPSRFTLCKRPQWWQRRGLIATERLGRPGEAGARPVMARPRSQVHQHQTPGHLGLLSTLFLWMEETISVSTHFI